MVEAKDAFMFNIPFMHVNKLNLIHIFIDLNEMCRFCGHARARVYSLFMFVFICNWYLHINLFHREN